jgi:hypothetical protein
LLVCLGSGVAPELCCYGNHDNLPFDAPDPEPPTSAELDLARHLRAALGLPAWDVWKMALDARRNAKNGDTLTDEEGRTFTIHNVTASFKTTRARCSCGSKTLGLFGRFYCLATGLERKECGKKKPTRGSMKWAESARASCDNGGNNRLDPDPLF